MHEVEYFVISGAQRFGPADAATLQQWADEGRVSRDMQLEDSTGRMFVASDLLKFKADTPPPGYKPPSVSQMPGGMGPTQAEMGRTPGGGGQFQQYPRDQMNYDTGNKEFKISLWALIIGFFCCPIVGEIVSIVYAKQSMDKGNSNAKVIFVLAIVLLVLVVIGGIFRGIAVASAFQNIH